MLTTWWSRLQVKQPAMPAMSSVYQKPREFPVELHELLGLGGDHQATWP